VAETGGEARFPARFPQERHRTSRGKARKSG
jgi:hypothetical protein